MAKTAGKEKPAADGAPRRVTQAELARELGLTQETISHALRGTGTLSEATRERVKALAAKRGYRPHAIARSMQKGSFDAIGLLTSTHGTAWPMLPSTMRGIHEVLHEADLNLVYARLPDDKFLSEKGAPRILTELMVDALILNLGPDTARAAVDLVDSSHIPAVLINKNRERNCVYPDEIAAGGQAAQLLISLGHRQIGFLSSTPPPDEVVHFSFTDRREGCLQAVEAAGLIPLRVESPRASNALLRAAIRNALLGQNDFQGTPITGFVTGSRGCAEILLLEAIRLGLEPGRDFSLITIDMGGDPCGDIQIDFLRTPAYWLGRESAQFAIDLLKSGKSTLPSRKVAYRNYLEGQTVGPPPNSPGKTS
jgi:LacI family transcriptional regulator